MSPPQLPDIHPMHSHTEMTALTNRFRKVLEHRLGTLACKRTSGAEQNCTTERRRMGIKVRGALEIRLSQIAGGQKSSCCA